MHVGRRIAIAIGACGLLGLGLGLGVSRAGRPVESSLRSVTDRAATTRSAEYLDEQLGQWLVLSDLVIGSGETYLHDGAVSLGHRIDTRLANLTAESLIAGVAPPRVLEGFVHRNLDRLDAAFAAAGSDRRTTLNRLVAELDGDAMDGLEDLDRLRRGLRTSVADGQAGLEANRARAFMLTGAACLLWFAAIAAAWWWVTRAVARPLSRLARAADRALTEQVPLTLEATGATEVQALTRSFVAFAGSLERTVEQRTRALEVTNAELTVARDAAEAAVLARSRFFANMSHEIRTPLTSILGFAQIHDLLPPSEQQEAMCSIRRNGDHLLHLINEILDLSKIEAGEMRLERVPLRLHDVVDEVGEMMSGTARERGLEFRIEVADEVPEWVDGDPVRLRQILLNLLGNAIKFTETGYVAVAVRADADHIHLSVRDTGCGLNPAERSRIFNAFSQADDSTTRRFGGTGLGLAIVARLVQLFEGDIAVDSAPGKGSTFTVSLPRLDVESPATTEAEVEADHPARAILAPGDPADELHGDEPAATGAAAAGDPRSDPLAGARFEPASPGERRPDPVVLVVDDDRSSLAIIRHHLQALDVEARTFADTPAFFDHLAGGGDGDLLILDLRLPTLDGVAAIRQLRALGVRTPVLIVTSDPSPEVCDAVAEAGGQGLLAKPIDAKALQKTVSEWLRVSAETDRRAA